MTPSAARAFVTHRRNPFLNRGHETRVHRDFLVVVVVVVTHCSHRKSGASLEMKPRGS